MFTLKEGDLRKLCRLNSFTIPNDEMIFFGLRGCIPYDDSDHTFRSKHKVKVVPINHANLRCTVIQWKPGLGIALFRSSTVPHQTYIRDALTANGEGANRLMTGRYPNYKKGVHRAGSSTGHHAFRYDAKLPIRRTANDLNYGTDDRVEYETPFDNIHAAWSSGPDYDGYGSAGCQVIAGYPQCESRGNSPDNGPWRVFKENAYALKQSSFTYILLPGAYVQKVSETDSSKKLRRLRFGSNGDNVASLQQKLSRLNLYQAQIDGDFGAKTLFALLDYQTKEFGPNQDSGVVGLQTAAALGIALSTR
ncbi:MAG: peptidoglycan-binding domain-containing protein [Chloroflexota bacterium]